MSMCVRPDEIGGEDVADDVPDSIQDRTEPTEEQKREIFKLHRGLGHPQPADFGRALRHAAAKRHIIRWAVHDMCCLTCEARVKPTARRPGALPRSLKFNQVVGVDLVEFAELKLIFCNILSWVTGYQMAG